MTVELPIAQQGTVRLEVPSGPMHTTQAQVAGLVLLLLALSVGYFGFLFLMLRWWTQAEWTRYTRLSVWALAVCVTLSAIL